MRAVSIFVLLLSLVAVAWLLRMGAPSHPARPEVGDSNQTVIGSWPRPSDAGDLQRDASDQRTRVAGVGKRVSGTVVDASGASVRARVVVEVGSSGASVEGSTDANGHFAVFLEGAAGIIRVVCTAAPALRGEHSTALAIDDTTQDVGVIVVRHLVTLTLRLLAKSGAVSRLGMDPTERVEVVLRKAGQGFAATLAQEAVASFGMAGGDSVEHRCVIACPAGSTLEWRFRNYAGTLSTLHSEPVPDHVEEMTSTWSFDLDNLLFGEVVSAAGVAQPGVCIQVVVDHPSQQVWELRTDEIGHFGVPVSKGAFGVLRVKAEHEANSDIRKGAVPWSPGALVPLIADLNPFLRMAILLDGERVRRFRVSLRNEPFRAASGALEVRPSIRLGSDCDFVTEFTRLEAGQRLFVAIPERGEFVQDAPRTWTAADGVYRIDLSKPVSGKVGFRLSGILPSVDRAASALRVHMLEERASSFRASYRFDISPAQLAATWICQHVVPGAYRCTMQWGQQHKTGVIEVPAEGVLWLDVTMP